MYIGPFYFDTKEIFLILAALLVGLAWKLGWGFYWFDKRLLLVVVGMMLLTKSLLSTLNNEAFFILALATIFLTLYLTIFQLIIFYLVGFTLMRWLKLI